MKKWIRAAVPPRISRAHSFAISDFATFDFTISAALSALLLSYISYFCISSAFAQEQTDRIRDIISALPGKMAGISVVDLSSSREVISHNSDMKLQPASILKLVTATAALNYLGVSYRFKTRIYQLSHSPENNVLAIRGGGDPELTTEQVYLLARKIRLLGMKNITSILIDSSALSDPSENSGQRAYETGGDALTFNFNSIGFHICPGPAASKSMAYVEPLLWEDPVEVRNEVRTVKGSQSSLELSYLGQSKFLIRGTVGIDSKCTERYLANSANRKSFAQYLAALLEQMGQGSKIAIRYGKIPQNAELVYEFESKPLSQIISGLNHYSTNVTAEQVLAAIGGEPDGFNLSRAGGLKKIKTLFREIGVSDLSLHDGSGLSRENRISAGAISALLSFAWRKPEIRPFLEVSLPILGESGTLKKRKEPDGGYRVSAKSGTLDGVSSLAGYLYLSAGRSYAFSIIQNEVTDSWKAHRAEELILEELAEIL